MEQPVLNYYNTLKQSEYIYTENIYIVGLFRLITKD